MRILFAWEVGHHFGHATQIATVARALKKRRAQVWMALKTPTAGMKFMEDFPGRILQAPYHPLAPGKRQQPLTYAEGLIPCGYESAETLAPLIASWRSLFDLVKPDALVTEAAPTALLASRGLKFKRMTFGRGFDVPPLSAPMPPFRYWEENDLAAIRRREDVMLKTINDALKKLKLKPIKHFSQMMETDREFLCTFKELDHYPARPKAEYYGPLFESSAGVKIDWNKNAAKRIFAYVSPGPPRFMDCVEALKRLPRDHDVIMACKGLPEHMREKLETRSLRIVSGPVQLERLLKTCDLAVTNASSGLSNALALAGVPSLMLPLHIEQLMSARAVGRAGMGGALIGHVTSEDISRKLQELLSQTKYRDRAREIAAKYKKFSPEALATKIAGEIMK